MSLYRAETRRLVKRRFTKLFVAGVLLILAAVAAGTFVTNRKIGPAEIAAAQAHARAEYEQAVAAMARAKQECEAARGTPAEAQFPPGCELAGPTEADFNPQWYMRATFDFREKFPDMVTTLAALLALMAYVVGASFVGAEWTSGGMMNLLLWRPQRLRVLGTKLAALLVGLTALTAVLAAAWTGIFVLIAELRGSMAGMTSGAWRSLGLMELRALGLVLAAGAIGFGLASIGRHTAMALGVAIGVVVVLQFGLGAVLSLAKVKFFEMYLIPVWVITWMDKSYRIQDYTSCEFSPVNGCAPDSITLTWPMAGGVLATATILIVGAALWTLRSRDIT